MNPQNVTIHLTKSTVTSGVSTKLMGKSSVYLHNDLVTIEQLNGKSWKKFGTTHEGSGGTFSYTIPGYAHEYRAVVADDPGYFQFGYSNGVTVTVKKKN
jgi:hypothetical protein